MGLVAMGQVTQENSQLWITLTDVTERQIFEDELAKNEREINLLLQNMVRGFVHFKTLLDGKGRTEDLIFLRINDAFERLTGLNEENVLGRKVTEVFPNIHELEFEWIHNLGNVASTGDSAYYEKFFEPLDRWYSISTFCPEPGFCAATFADITELKKIEGSLERANEELEQRNRELEAFVYTTTHDLRTPLVSGYGFLQMLNGKISDKLDEDQKIMMENIINSFHVSDALLRDLGEFSQVESGKESIKVSSIESIIEKIKEVERGMIKITNASIKVQEDLPSILLHESRGYQLFKNLVSNSLKYARENIPLEIEIGLSTEHSEEIPSNYRVFFFKDNSIGIDQDTEDRYFGSSALNEIKDKGGPGIRLAIVKRIVELDKGKIWVDTTKQKGIVFYISLGILEEKPN
jgi:PAS domain S-box-containing protein